MDDAAGEAFDKVAKLLGLPYPGGPWMDALARHGVADTALFAIAQVKQKATGHVAPKLVRDRAADAAAGEANAGGLPLRQAQGQDEGEKRDAARYLDERRFDMSFSGIKTAVRRYVETHGMQASIAERFEALRAAGIDKAKPDAETVARALKHFDKPTLDLIASFQHAVVKNLARQTFKAAEQFGSQGVLVSGGVAANSLLREVFVASAEKAKLPVAFPSIALSTDNAAMIAAAAWPKFVAGEFAGEGLVAVPQLRLG